MAATKMNLLQMALAGKIADKAQSVLRRQARRQVFRPRQHFLPLGIKPQRETRFEFRGWDRADERETCPVPGAGRRYQDIRV